MIQTYYCIEKVLRETASGKRWVRYRYWENFGRERGYAYSWGCREKNGYGKIWLNPGEDIYNAVDRED